MVVDRRMFQEQGLCYVFNRPDNQSEAPSRDTNIVFSNLSPPPRKPSWRGLTNWIMNSQIAIRNTAATWFVKLYMNSIWDDLTLLPTQPFRWRCKPSSIPLILE